jgi:hypothetical protein
MTSETARIPTFRRSPASQATPHAAESEAGLHISIRTRQFKHETSQASAERKPRCGRSGAPQRAPERNPVARRACSSLTCRNAGPHMNLPVNVSSALREVERLIRASCGERGDQETVSQIAQQLSCVEATMGRVRRVHEKTRAIEYWVRVMCNERRHARFGGPELPMLFALEDCRLLQSVVHRSLMERAA